MADIATLNIFSFLDAIFTLYFIAKTAR